MSEINLFKDDLTNKLINIFTDLSKSEISKSNFFKSRAYNLSRSKISEGKLYAITENNRVVIYNTLGEMYTLGESSSRIFIDILNTGFTNKLESGPELGELINISGLGPSKVTALSKVNITKVKDLIGLNLKIGDKILNSGVRYTEQIDTGIKLYLKTGNKRISYELATEYLKDLKITLLNSEVKNFNMYVAGSYRRCRRTVGDLDIILTNHKDKEIIGDIRSVVSKWLDHIFVNGSKKISGVKYETQVDFRFIDRKYLGAHLLHCTGSSDFNIYMRRIAKDQGMKLNEYGIINNGELITFDNEKDIFSYLKVNYLNPKDR
jgi:DNA polymerase (family 10)